jgi:hypothetical protein
VAVQTDKEVALVVVVQEMPAMLRYRRLRWWLLQLPQPPRQRQL